MPTEGSARGFVEADTSWAISVARELDRLAGDREPGLDDLWVTDAPALAVRYQVGTALLALRYSELGLDPTSAAPPIDSVQMASNLLHGLHASDDPAWTDADGYAWWGTPPAGGWPAVSDERRVLTLRPAAGRGAS